MENDYDRALHRTYAEGRVLSAEAQALWTDTFRPHLAPGARALDVGCGTGRFTALLEELTGTPAVGVDVSRRMLARAGGLRVLGAAEFLPLSRGSFDFALLSMVTHHFRDLPAACRELARVLRPGGRAFLRTGFGGRLGGFCYYRFFPAARRIDDARLAPAAVLESAFARAGFRCRARDRVLQRTDESLAAHRARLATRAISTFEFLSEREIEDGFRAMDEAIRRGDEPGPVLDPIEVLVFERR